MKRLLFAALFCTTFNSFGQTNPAFSWAKSFGTANSDQARSIVTDASGNVYSVGYFSGTGDFDPGSGTTALTASGAQDLYIQKLDVQGDLVWAKNIGGPSAGVQVSSIGMEINGGLIIGGSFSGGTVDFDPGAGVANYTATGFLNNDSYFLKLTADGDFVFVKIFDGSGYTEVKTVTSDAFGYLYVVGNFSGTIDLDPGASVSNSIASGGNNTYAVRMDPSGNYVWGRILTGGNNFASAACVNNVTNVLHITGSFQGTVDFNPGAAFNPLTAVGNTDAFLVSIAYNGNLSWYRHSGIGESNDKQTSPKSIATDINGNVFLTGTMNNASQGPGGNIDFDPGAGIANLTVSDNEDAFIQKFDASGIFQWVKGLNAPGSELTEGIACDASGNAYITGSFSGTVDFDSNAGVANKTATFYDLFVLKLNPNGEYQWVTQNGGVSSFVKGMSIQIDASDNILTTGFYYATANFNGISGTEDLTAVGSHDSFIQKLGQVACTPNSGTDVQTSCASSFIWIDGLTYSASNNTATHTLMNAGGCDSIVTLNLTMNVPTSSTTTHTACYSYTWNSGTYSTSGQYTWVGTNAAGCDSIATLDLTVTSIVNTISGNASGLGVSDITQGGTYQWVDCNDGNAEILGETNAYYYPTYNSSFACVITIGNCSATTNCISITTIGIDENTSIELSVFPNPAKDMLTILSEATISEITVLDATGKIVKTVEEASFSIEELNSGVYFLAISTDYGTVQRKFIKE